MSIKVNEILIAAFNLLLSTAAIYVGETITIIRGKVP